MGDLNLKSSEVEDTKRGSVGRVQDVAHHPVESWFARHESSAKINSDFIIAGDSTITPIKLAKDLPGLDGTHVAVMAKITYRASTLVTSGPPLAEGVTEPDVAAAEAVMAEQEARQVAADKVSPAPEDAPMAQLTVRHLQQAREIAELLGPADSASTPAAASPLPPMPQVEPQQQQQQQQQPQQQQQQQLAFEQIKVEAQRQRQQLQLQQPEAASSSRTGQTEQERNARAEGRAAEMRELLNASTLEENLQENLQELQRQERQELQRDQALQAVKEQQEEQQQEFLPDWGGGDAAPAEASFDAADADAHDSANAGGPFRREGLPCRVLVERKGSYYADCGGVDCQVGESLEYGLIFSWIRFKPTIFERNKITESREPQLKRNCSASTLAIFDVRKSVRILDSP